MFKSQFINNVLTLSSGTFLSQLILFLGTPILTRIYNPESFGILALYLSIVGIFWTISSGKYELAIVLPDERQTALNLLALSIIINIFFFFLSLLIAFLFIKNFNLKIIFLFIPFGIFIESIISSINQYNNRNKKYKYMSVIKIFRSIIVTLLQILFYHYGIENFGLLWGVIIGSFISLLFLIIPHYQILINTFRGLIKNELLVVAKNYIRFPKFQALSAFLNAISQNSILLLLSLFYGPIIVGYYSLAHRTLRIPIVLISDSVRQIFYKEGADLINNKKNISNLFNKTTIALLLISLPITLLVWNFLPSLFVFVFGNEWFITGEYAQILIFWLLFAFINPPAVASIQLLGLQKQFMIYELFLLLFRFFSIYLGYYLYSDVIISLKLFALISVFFNFILIIYIYIKVK